MCPMASLLIPVEAERAFEPLSFNHCCHIGTYLRKWYVKCTILPKTLFYGTFFAYKVGIS